jgi:hypothetical protein
LKHFPSPHAHLGAEDGEAPAGHERQRGRGAAPAGLEQHDRLQRRLGSGHTVASDIVAPDMFASLVCKSDDVAEPWRRLELA